MKIVSRLFIAAVLAGAAWIALAGELRAIPAAAKLAKVAPLTVSSVLVDGKQAHLAPGARIYSQDNRTLVAGAIPKGADARVLSAPNGDVMGIWILTADEAAAAR